VLQPFTIDGYQLPVGTVISPSIYLAHHRKAVYPDSDVFRPERFLVQQFSAYEFLPFGGGSRRCIGGELTKFEIKLIVATVLKQMQMETFDSKPVLPVRYGITMSPPANLSLKIV
jgi:cytochrome P450 family 110